MTDEVKLFNVAMFAHAINCLSDRFCDGLNFRCDTNVVPSFRVVAPVNGDHIVIATINVSPTNGVCAQVEFPRLYPAMDVDNSWQLGVEGFVLE